MSSDELTSFLGEDEEEKQLYEQRPTRPRSRLPVIATLVVTNIAFLLVCIFLSLKIWSMPTVGVRESIVAEPYSPANSIIKYEHRKMIFNDTRFTGHPSAAWEENMHDLLEGTLLRVSDHELQQHGFDSIPLKDGGYAAGLGISHGLHCTKKLKMFLYSDYFYPDLDPRGPEMATIQEHADHCLDWIRQSMMCHIDYSMYTLLWTEEDDGRLSLKHNVPGVQKCANWESLHDWMKSRSANSDMLERPGEIKL